MGIFRSWAGSGRAGLTLQLAGLAACVALSAGAQPVGRPAEREVTVTNRAGRPLNEIYLSPASADAWGDDQLGDAQLAPGQAIRLRTARTRDCVFDMRVVYADAGTEELRGLDLCRTRAVAVQGAAAPVGLPERALTIADESARPLFQLFITPVDAGDWGDDLLGPPGLSVGERRTLRLALPCAVDVRVVFDNRGAEERRGVDLCRTGTLTIRPGWTTEDALAEADTPMRLVVSNRAGQTAERLTIGPEGGPGGGAASDNLLDRPLPAGAEVVVPWARRGCRQQARVGFGAAAPDQAIGGLDFCVTDRLVIPPRP